MATTRKATRKKGKTATGNAKAKVKRVARKAKKSLGVAAHKADLALSRTGRKLKGAAQDLGTKLEESKAPAKRHAKRVERTVLSTLESAGDFFSEAMRKAKSQIADVTKK